jgi:integrase
LTLRVRDLRFFYAIEETPEVLIVILASLVSRIAMECDLEPCTVAQYDRAIRKFSEFLGETALAQHLTTDYVNSFLLWQKKAGKSGTTIRNYRVSLTRVWNLAVENGLCEPYNPRRLRTARIVQRPVLSWTPSQIAMLVAAAEKLPGSLRCGLSVAGFLSAWLRVGYDTGIRPIDLRSLSWASVDLGAGTITFTQHKTRKPHVGRLSKTSVKLLQQIRYPARNLVFPLTKGGVRRIELQLFEFAASLGFSRMSGQGLGTLRKTHATQIYEQEGEYAAAESLGHVGGVRTVRASYIDSRVIRSGRLPPSPPVPKRLA